MVNFGFIKKSKWHKDICEYYKVTPRQALSLSRRTPGRRPDLPPSPTTAAVSNKTFKEIWDLRPRNTAGAIQQFYRDMGAWATFRQCYYHRRMDAGHFLKGAKPGSSICEYGSGVAPVCNWVVENIKGIPLHLTIVDLESEHLAFAKWRLNKKIAQNNLPFRLNTLTVKGNDLPLNELYDIILVLEVFEHIHNPRDVIVHLTDHLQKDGLLHENYVVCTPEEANLEEAQSQRKAVFEFMRGKFRLIKGRDPDRYPNDLRCWKKD